LQFQAGHLVLEMSKDIRNRTDCLLGQSLYRLQISLQTDPPYSYDREVAERTRRNCSGKHVSNSGQATLE